MTSNETFTRSIPNNRKLNDVRCKNNERAKRGTVSQRQKQVIISIIYYIFLENVRLLSYTEKKFPSDNTEY